MGTKIGDFLAPRQRQSENKRAKQGLVKRLFDSVQGILWRFLQSAIKRAFDWVLSILMLGGLIFVLGWFLQPVILYTEDGNLYRPYVVETSF